jgi:Flp pilus assembly secretin CpaC
MTFAPRWRVPGATTLVLVALQLAPPVLSARQLVPPSGAAPTVLIRSQYQRLVFPQEIQRIAVADTEILTAELVTSREVLVLGRQTGRTTLIVWFTNGASRERSSESIRASRSRVLPIAMRWC